MKIVSRPDLGAQAIIQTAHFRCLAFMGAAGYWIDAHNPTRIFYEVIAYELLPTMPIKIEIDR